VNRIIQLVIFAGEALACFYVGLVAALGVAASYSGKYDTAFWIFSFLGMFIGWVREIDKCSELQREIDELIKEAAK
jgi:hypothetical protein